MELERMIAEVRLHIRATELLDTSDVVIPRYHIEHLIRCAELVHKITESEPWADGGNLHWKPVVYKLSEQAIRKFAHELDEIF